METTTINFKQYLAIFPDGEKWYSASPGFKKLEQAYKNDISILVDRCQQKGQVVNPLQICKNVAAKAGKGILLRPYHLLYAASSLARLTPAVTHEKAFNLVASHLVKELNERYKNNNIELSLELLKK